MPCFSREREYTSSALWEIPVFHLTGRAGDIAGPDTHQMVDEQEDEGSKAPSLIISPLSQCL